MTTTECRPTAFSNEALREVQQLVERSIGCFDVVASYREGSERSQVWRLGAGANEFILKLHAEPRKWHPEVYAYKNWVGVNRPYVPELIAVFDGEGRQGILTTAMKGMPFRDTPLPLEQALDVYRRAGELARQMHDQTTGEWFGVPQADGSPLGKSYDDPVEFMTAEFYRWCGEALRQGAGLEPGERAMAHWALEHMEAFAGEPAVPVNRDYTPKNWLVTKDGYFAGVIDFECLQWSVRTDAFFALWSNYFPQTPGAETAFFLGYRRNVVEEYNEQVCVLKVYLGLSDIHLGRLYGDEHLIQQGHEKLQKLVHDPRFVALTRV